MSQTTLISYSPDSGRPIQAFSAAGYRRAFPMTIWSINPWTGQPRDPRDVESDPRGLLILPPGEALKAATRNPLEGGQAGRSISEQLERCLAAAEWSAGRRLAADMSKVLAEVASARANWPPFNSAHEGFAVLLEEVDELKAHVWTNQKRRDLVAMRKEAVQVAAMAIRFMQECCSEETGRK